MPNNRERLVELIDWTAEIERLAREAEKEALAKADEIFAEAAAEHERQTIGYHFECRRWGDYLSVFVDRKANSETSLWYGERKTSTALNIGQTNEIEIVLGRCFDRRGELEYVSSVVSDDGQMTEWRSDDGMRAPPKGWHYEVRPAYPTAPLARPTIIRTGSVYSDNIFITTGHRRPRHKTAGYPRFAVDDEIRFVGIGATLYAPAGKGQAVYDAIMAEMARGYEPPDRSSSIA